MLKDFPKKWTYLLLFSYVIRLNLKWYDSKRNSDSFCFALVCDAPSCSHIVHLRLQSLISLVAALCAENQEWLESVSDLLSRLLRVLTERHLSDAF